MPVDFLNPYFPAELGKMAVDLAAGAADAAAAAGWIAEADRQFTRAESLQPRDLDVMRGRLELHLLRGDLESALVLSREIARLHPASIPCQVEVGDVLLQMGRYQEASDALHKAWLRSACKDQRAVQLIREAQRGLHANPPEPTPETRPPRRDGVHST